MEQWGRRRVNSSSSGNTNVTSVARRIVRPSHIQHGLPDYHQHPARQSRTCAAVRHRQILTNPYLLSTEGCFCLQITATTVQSAETGGLTLIPSLTHTQPRPLLPHLIYQVCMARSMLLSLQSCLLGRPMRQGGTQADQAVRHMASGFPDPAASTDRLLSR